MKCLLCFLLAAACGAVELRTDSLIYTISESGQNTSFRDQRTSKEYLAKTGPAMTLIREGRRIPSTAARLEGDLLRVGFGASEATLRIGRHPKYLTFELLGLSGPSVSSVELANLPLTLTRYVSQTLASCRDEEYAAAVIPLNLETHSVSSKGVLVAEADRRVKLTGAKFALVACPAAQLLDRIEEIELAHGLPHPTLGGVWARRSPEQMRSYLFVDLSEATAPAVIEYAKAGGFGYIVVYDGTWTSSHGSYLINRKNFPRGEAGLKAVSDQIHGAGLKFGMHNLDMVIDKSDPLVHPVPAKGFMMYPDRRRTLAAAIGPADTFIPTTTSPSGLLAKSDKSRFHGRDLRIGDEIITYDDLKLTEPYGFTGCRRGAHGTVAAAHPAGAAIDNFSEFIGYYRPDVKSDLYDRVARNAAAALEEFGFDYIYPDGTGENLGYWPDPPEWYAYNLLISKLVGYTRREVMWAHMPITDYSWHIFSRGNTTDYVHTGVIEHFDRVSVAGAKDSAAELQPFEFGWFGFFTHAYDNRATRPREMEYAWSKALAYGAAMSLETRKSALDANGRTREIFSIVRNWEELKLKGYFPERIREQLKAPGKEFALDRTPDGDWQVLPLEYSPDRYARAGDAWTFQNPYQPQPPRITLEAMPVLAGHGDPGNTVLLDAARPLKLNTEGSGPLGSPSRQNEGLSFELKRSVGVFEVSAVNSGTVPLGWGCAEVILDSVKDLRKHRALGAPVEGDGSGAYLHFVIEDSGRWSVRDYYVRLDFQGRRYIEMPESAEGEVYDFAFPYSNYWSIRNIDFRSIARVYVFLSGVKPGQSVRARFGRLEGLEETPAVIENPALRINGERVAFPTRLKTGWYLEYSGVGRARVFNPNGYSKGEVVPKGTPRLRGGNNQIAYERGGAPAKVTVSVRGAPLR